MDLGRTRIVFACVSEMKRTLFMMCIHRVGVSRVVPKFSGGQLVKKRDYNKDLDRTNLRKKLLKYDNGEFDYVKTKHTLDTIVELDMGMVEDLIHDLREELSSMGECTDRFGNCHNNAIEGMVRSISLTFDGELLYPTVEAQAAQLLYSVIKGHPFLDGNKRIAVSLFIKFLELNQYLVDEHGDCVLSNGHLLTLVIMVAKSKPEEQEEIIKSIVDILIRES